MSNAAPKQMLVTSCDILSHSQYASPVPHSVLKGVTLHRFDIAFQTHVPLFLSVMVSQAF
jgi:hypothetical protein